MAGSVLSSILTGGGTATIDSTACGIGLTGTGSSSLWGLFTFSIPASHHAENHPISDTECIIISALVDSPSDISVLSVSPNTLTSP